jgi:hypothetical protein
VFPAADTRAIDVPLHGEQVVYAAGAGTQSPSLPKSEIAR